MTSLTLQEIKVDQIWRDRDPRFRRLIKVMSLISPYSIRIQTCDTEGMPVKGSRISSVSRDRFLKAFSYVEADNVHSAQASN